MYLDLHVHSRKSFDSLINPQKAIKLSIKKGLSGIAFTDHDKFYHKEIEEDDFIIIRGIEKRSNLGDILGLFITGDVKGRDAYEILDSIKDNDGISILAHPFKRVNFDYPQEFLTRVDAIEVFNSRSKTNFEALQLASDFKKPMTAGSDAHFYFEIGRGKTMIKNANYGLSELKKEILSHRTSIEGVNTPKYVESLSLFLKHVKKRKIPRSKSLLKEISDNVKDSSYRRKQ